MSIAKKEVSKKALKIKPEPVINDELKKYHHHPVVLKKMEQGRKMMGIK